MKERTLLSINSKGKPMWSDIETPDLHELNNKAQVAALLAEEHCDKAIIIRTDSLEAEVLDSIPSYAERQAIVAMELGTASFRAMPHHTGIVDDMSHFRDEATINWLATSLYAKQGDLSVPVLGNVIFLPNGPD